MQIFASKNTNHFRDFHIDHFTCKHLSFCPTRLKPVGSILNKLLRIAGSLVSGLNKIHNQRCQCFNLFCEISQYHLHGLHTKFWANVHFSKPNDFGDPDFASSTSMRKTFVVLSEISIPVGLYSEFTKLDKKRPSRSLLQYKGSLFLIHKRALLSSPCFMFSSQGWP